jgi:hypothetical protein
MSPSTILFEAEFLAQTQCEFAGTDCVTGVGGGLGPTEDDVSLNFFDASPSFYVLACGCSSPITSGHHFIVAIRPHVTCPFHRAVDGQLGGARAAIYTKLVLLTTGVVAREAGVALLTTGGPQESFRELWRRSTGTGK